jgi:stage II sporulation protein AA (anti-sigma F factor antagonist)
MEFSHHSMPEGIVVVLNGPFTFKDHHIFRAVLDLLKDSGGRSHVLDLSAVGFLDSAALGMLLIAEEEAKEAGAKLTLRKPARQIAELIELAALDTLFTIER